MMAAKTVALRVARSVEWLVVQKVSMAGLKVGSTAEQTAALMAFLKVVKMVSVLVVWSVALSAGQ
jgi:hypothetical protein